MKKSSMLEKMETYNALGILSVLSLGYWMPLALHILNSSFIQSRFNLDPWILGLLMGSLLTLIQCVFFFYLGHKVHLKLDEHMKKNSNFRIVETRDIGINFWVIQEKNSLTPILLIDKQGPGSENLPELVIEKSEELLKAYQESKDVSYSSLLKLHQVLFPHSIPDVFFAMIKIGHIVRLENPKLQSFSKYRTIR